MLSRDARTPKKTIALITAFAAAACAGPSRNAVALEEPAGIFTNLPKNFARSFEGYRLSLQIGAVGSTALLSGSGADAGMTRLFLSGNSDIWATPAVYIGLILPPLLLAGTYVGAHLTNNHSLLEATFAGTQAVGLTLAYVTALKFLTGRPAANHDASTNLDQQSITFHPGFGREGVVDGWPSGHTAVMTALATSIAAYYDMPLGWGVAAAVSTYTALAMTATSKGTQHWFSDTVAGLAIGYSIGSSVGEGFRTYAGTEGKVAFSPIVHQEGAGVLMSVNL